MSRLAPARSICRRFCVRQGRPAPCSITSRTRARTRFSTFRKAWSISKRSEGRKGRKGRMNVMSRRDFLRSTAAETVVTGFLAAGGATLRAKPLGLPIGSQTYPHRARLKEDLPRLLKQFADLGIEAIELCSPFGYAEFAGLANGDEVRKL